MADELGISLSAYSKIERAVTDPSISRVAAIAGILEVDVTYFFQEQTTGNKFEDPNKSYGFATKSDVEELTSIINKIKQEIASLKATLQTQTTKKKKKIIGLDFKVSFSTILCVVPGMKIGTIFFLPVFYAF